MDKPLVEQLQSMIDAQMPKTSRLGPVIEQPAIDIDVPYSPPAAPIVSAAPASAAPVEKKPGLSSNILDELAKYQGLPSTLEESTQMTTKSYEPLLKSLEGKKQDASWEDFIAIALPTIVGGAMGQFGTGAQIGGDYGIQRSQEIKKRNESLEDAMTRVKAQIAVQQAKNRKEMQEKKVEVMGEDGNAYLVPESFAIQRGLQAFKEGSFDRVVFTDNDGKQKLGVFNKKRGEYTVPEDALLAEQDKTSLTEAGRDKRQKEAQLYKAKTTFMSPNSDFGKILEEIRTTTTAMHLLNTAGTYAESGLPALIARGVFREKGPLSDRDISRVTGDPSGAARLSRVWDRFIDGTLPNPDREDIAILLKAAHLKAVERARKTTKAYSTAFNSPELSKDLMDWSESLIEPMPELQKGKLPTREKNKILTAAIEGEEDIYKYVKRPMTGPDGKVIKNPDGTDKMFTFKQRRDGKRMESGKIGVLVVEE